jgi:hypothetical protein
MMAYLTFNAKGPENDPRYKKLKKNDHHKRSAMFGDILSGNKIPEMIGIRCSSGVMKVSNPNSTPRFGWDPHDNTQTYFFGLPVRGFVSGWSESPNARSSINIKRASILVGRLNKFISYEFAPSSNPYLIDGSRINSMLTNIMCNLVDNEREKLIGLEKTGDAEEAAELAHKINLIKYVCLGNLNGFPWANRSWVGAIIVPSRYSNVPQLAAVLDFTIYSSRNRDSRFMMAYHDFGNGTWMEDSSRLDHLVYGNQLAMSVKR